MTYSVINNSTYTRNWVMRYDFHFIYAFIGISQYTYMTSTLDTQAQTGITATTCTFVSS